MFKLKDKFILGFFSALIVTMSLNILDWLTVLFHLNKWHIWQVAGSLYFDPDKLSTVPALFLGAVAHTSILTSAGVLICYLLYFTGRKYYLVKGLSVLMVYWIFLFGIILRLGIARIKPLDAGTNISHFIGHAVAGLLISYAIVRLADQRAWNT